MELSKSGPWNFLNPHVQNSDSIVHEEGSLETGEDDSFWKKTGYISVLCWFCEFNIRVVFSTFVCWKKWRLQFALLFVHPVPNQSSEQKLASNLWRIIRGHKSRRRLCLLSMTLLEILASFGFVVSRLEPSLHHLTFTFTRKELWFALLWTVHSLQCLH